MGAAPGSLVPAVWQLRGRASDAGRVFGARAGHLSPPPTSTPTRLTTPVAAPLTANWVRTQFKRTDDGSGGRLQTLRRGLKFWWRCWWHAAPLRVSTRAFQDSCLDSIVDREPTLPLRPLRSYLRRGLDSGRRAQAVEAHFNWLTAHFPRPFIDQLYAGESAALLAGTTLVEGLGLTLSRSAHLGREGELALHLEWQGARVMSMAFSVIDANLVVAHATRAGAGAPAPQPRVVIGAIQGATGAQVALRELSAAAQRLRPAALLVLAVQALSQAWGLAAPLAVASKSHVYAGYASRRRQVALDYDSHWRDAGGGLLDRHYWTLPAQPVLRPDSEVESRRRAQHRRRNQLRVGVLDAVSAASAGLQLGALAL